MKKLNVRYPNVHVNVSLPNCPNRRDIVKSLIHPSSERAIEPSIVQLWKNLNDFLQNKISKFYIILIIQELKWFHELEMNWNDGLRRLRREMSSSVVELSRKMSIRELEEALECPVCAKVPQSTPIFQCQNGHMICKTCHAKITGSFYLFFCLSNPFLKIHFHP